MLSATLTYLMQSNTNVSQDLLQNLHVDNVVSGCQTETESLTISLHQGPYWVGGIFFSFFVPFLFHIIYSWSLVQQFIQPLCVV